MPFIDIDKYKNLIHEADEDEETTTNNQSEEDTDNKTAESDEDDYNLEEEVDEDDYNIEDDGNDESPEDEDDDYNLDTESEEDEDDYNLPDEDEDNSTEENEETPEENNNNNEDTDNNTTDTEDTETNSGDDGGNLNLNADDGGENDAGDDGDEDDYDIDTDGEDEEGGDEDTAGDSDDNISDDEDMEDEEDSENKSLSSQIADIEDRIYSDLSDDEKLNRVMELKGNCTKIYSDCTDIIEQISVIPKTTQNQEVIENLLEGLIRMKQCTLDYMTNTFDSRTYSENKDWYDKSKTFMVSVKNILDEMVKQALKNNSKFNTESVKEDAKLAKDKITYGIPKLKKYPLTDKKHVLWAIDRFYKAPEKYKKELALNIQKAAKHFAIKINKYRDGEILKYK